jgi:hypothetical protein
MSKAWITLGSDITNLKTMVIHPNVTHQSNFIILLKALVNLMGTASLPYG